MNKLFLLLGLVGAFCCLRTFGADIAGAPPPAAAPLLVEIDGVKLTLADFGRKHPGGLFRASQGFYEAERKVVEAWIDEYLLERAARRRMLQSMSCSSGT